MPWIAWSQLLSKPLRLRIRRRHVEPRACARVPCGLLIPALPDEFGQARDIDVRVLRGLTLLTFMLSEDLSSRCTSYISDLWEEVLTKKWCSFTATIRSRCYGVVCKTEVSAFFSFNIRSLSIPSLHNGAWPSSLPLLNNNDGEKLNTFLHKRMMLHATKCHRTKL